VTYFLSLPVRKSEIINAMLSRVNLEQMHPEERRLTVLRIQDAAGLIVSLVPDYLREVRVKTR
jgi:hypothetical protein